MEVQEIIERFVNPYGKFDEYEIFKELIFYLKNNFNNFFENFYKELNVNQLNILKDLCNTVRVNIVDENQKEVNVPRRIVKIRKNKMDI